MKGPEPRAPELEIPRPSGAGVGAQFPGLSSSLAFELGVCPECGSQLVEHNGLLVCGNCARNAFMTTFGSFIGERAERG
jgi:ribosomal protein S27AE